MSTDPSLQNLKCPKCEGPMVPRLNKKENKKFWGCKGYPDCKGTRDVDGLSWEDKQAQLNAGTGGKRYP